LSLNPSSREVDSEFVFKVDKDESVSDKLPVAHTLAPIFSESFARHNALTQLPMSMSYYYNYIVS
jgi:hypothetical protein